MRSFRILATVLAVGAGLITGCSGTPDIGTSASPAPSTSAAGSSSAGSPTPSPDTETSVPAPAPHHVPAKCRPGAGKR